MGLAMDKILYYINKPLQGSPSVVIYLFGGGVIEDNVTE